MSKKLYAVLAPWLVLGCFVAVPAAAQAITPHWYSCQEKAGKEKFKDPACEEAMKNGNYSLTKLKAGVPVDVTTRSAGLTITNALIGSVTCEEHGTGTIENPKKGAAGTGSIASFTFYNCKSASCPVIPEYISEGLPWHSELFEDANGVIRERITGIEVRLVCDSIFSAIYSGTLTPRFVSDLPSYAEFDAESGSLSNPELGEGTLDGTDAVEGPGGEAMQVFE